MTPQLQTQPQPTKQPEKVLYPDSDGQPMSDNTLQFAWIVKLKEGCEALFKDNPTVFVAGDLLWYPVEGDNKTRRAPDAMVVFGRPKGYRGSYQQWLEDNITPQVVFEILSPRNTLSEMALKLQFYSHFGVEEYYLYDPQRNDLTGWQRSETGLTVIESLDGWVSPRLGVRFVFAEPELEVIRPDGKRFLSYVELMEQRDEIEQQRDELEQQRDAIEQQRDRMAAKLKELGIDPTQL
ncbi:MAG: Uma2 family endonuclease [Microcoleus sp.]|uniref:Uma2 family endonuclease n=1 Tax=Microcoleus sp. TaxID=44472 RepID=UPI003525BE54